MERKEIQALMAYMQRILAGKEFEVGKNKVLGLGVKVTGAGGKEGNC